uniref:Uncharacterized protein n=1 Tax=Escherichia coli TaxID=562 RepID=A0A8F1LAW2_ECOLX|nr:hypothetical protein IHCLGBEB_00016 [Escherichia coli]
MDLAEEIILIKQELLERLLSGKRMTGRDEMDIKRILKTKEALDNIRNFIDKQRIVILQRRKARSQMKIKKA